MRHQGISKFAKLANRVEEQMKEVEDRDMLIVQIEEVSTGIDSVNAERLLQVKELEEQFRQGTLSGTPGLKDCTQALGKLVKQLEYIVYIQHSVYSTDLPRMLIWCFRECSKTMHNYEKSDFPCWSKIETCMRNFVNHKCFNNLVMTVILMNTLTMAATHHGQSEGLDGIQTMLNTAFVVFFLLEMILKHIGLGFSGYWGDGWNRFDGTIVIASIADMVLVGASGGGSWVSVFRALRLLRVFKMIKFLPAMQKQIDVLASAIAEIGYLGMLLGMLLFIFAILGMTLFGKAPSDTSMRPNFDVLSWSMLSVLSVVTLDNWTILMTSVVDDSSGLAALYFVALIVISRFFLFNMFIAVILQSFAEFRAEEEEKLVEELQIQRKNNASAFSLLGNLRDMHIKPKARLMFEEWKNTTQVRHSKLFTLQSWKDRDLEDNLFKKIRHHLAQFRDSFCTDLRINLRNECFRVWKDPSLSWGADEDDDEADRVVRTRRTTRRKSVQEIIDRAASVLWEASEEDLQEYNAQMTDNALTEVAPIAESSTVEEQPEGEWCSDLKAMDQNNDGVIDMAEWEAAGGTEEEFRKLDTNEDEGLDIAELEEVSAIPAQL